MLYHKGYKDGLIKLKERLKKEGNQSVTKCHRLKLVAADGKKKQQKF